MVATQVSLRRASRAQTQYFRRRLKPEQHEPLARFAHNFARSVCIDLAIGSLAESSNTGMESGL